METSNNSSLRNYIYPPLELEKIKKLFETNGWPINFLLNDNYGTKLLLDNQIFSLIQFYKHSWKYDDEDDEILILHKKTKNSPATFVKFSDLYPNLQIKVTSRGEYIFDGPTYTENGLEFEKTNFQFSSTEFRYMLAKFVKEGWPVQFLLRDHYGAKVFFDNQVFQLIEFYGHHYKWDEDQGLILMVKRLNGIEWVPWSEIADELPIQRTPQGWLLFDGHIYGQEGIIETHMWQWKTLNTSYVFSGPIVPNVCYVDIVTFNWEHDGWPGFGIGIGNPHGHTSIEFGDDLGNFYSVGMYMDPRSIINTKISPAATVRACLMSPDPYMPSKGEKTVHRYYLGKGKEGQEKIEKLKKYIEGIQNWTKNEETGIVKTCPRKYQSFVYNCGDFQEEIEKFTQEKLGGKLIPFDDTTVLVPRRTRVVKTRSNWFYETFELVWNTLLLFLMDVIISLVIKNPWLSKKIGSEKQDDFSDFDTKTTGQSEKGFSRFAVKNIKFLTRSLRPHSVKFPRKVRLGQLYSPRLKKYSAILRS